MGADGLLGWVDVDDVGQLGQPADEVRVNLVTGENTESEERARKQIEYLAKVRAGALGGGIQFNASFDGAIHDRSIVTDTGWKLILGRGLDIFQYVTGAAFALATRR